MRQDRPITLAVVGDSASGKTILTAEAAGLHPDRIGMYSDLAESRHSDPLALTQALITYHLLRAAQAGGGRETRWLS